MIPQLRPPITHYVQTLRNLSKFCPLLVAHTVLDIITFQKRVFLYKFIAFTHGCKQIAIISQAFPL